MARKKQPDLLRLTYSSIITWQTCPMRYYWRYERGWVPKEPNVYLAIGDMTHSGWAELERQGYTKRGLRKALSTISARCREMKYESDWLMTARFLIERYFERYGAQRGFDGASVLAVEARFDLDLDSHVVFSGKVDAVIRKKTEQVWLVERKTTARLDRDYLRKLPLDRQITAYLLGARALPCFAGNPDTEIAGVIYDVIGKPATYRRSGENCEMWLGRCSVEYAKLPTAYFARRACHRGSQDFVRFLEMVQHTASDVRRAQESQFWTQNTGMCFLRNCECPYTKLCIEGETDRTLCHFKFEEPHIELL